MTFTKEDPKFQMIQRWRGDAGDEGRVTFICKDSNETKVASIGDAVQASCRSVHKQSPHLFFRHFLIDPRNQKRIGGRRLEIPGDVQTTGSKLTEEPQLNANILLFSFMNQ